MLIWLVLIKQYCLYLGCDRVHFSVLSQGFTSIFQKSNQTDLKTRVDARVQQILLVEQRHHKKNNCKVSNSEA